MKYLIRSVKYFIALCVLYLIIMALMLLTNTSVLTPSEPSRPSSTPHADRC